MAEYKARARGVTTTRRKEVGWKESDWIRDEVLMMMLLRDGMRRVVLLLIIAVLNGVVYGLSWDQWTECRGRERMDVESRRITDS